MKTKFEVLKAILVLGILIGLAKAAIAAPWGADSVERVSDVRGTPGGSPQAVSAQAGNVTQLTINTTILTKRWQGYYGNITGKMTLSDASGYTLYDWSYDKDLSVTGEIYAANKSITSWANVLCVNLTGNGSIGSTDNATLNSLADLEGAFNMSSGDKDGFDETFTGYTNISIGTKDLTMCPSTNMYVNNATSNFWNETLLQENISTKTVIFATEVENDRVGFNGKTWDFQMIVADNGDIDAPTTYQFYVELV